MEPTAYPFWVMARRGRRRINPEVVDGVAELLVIHLARCEEAIDRMKRMRHVMDDGTETTNADYYDHAASYLRKALHDISSSTPVAVVKAAQETWRRTLEADVPPSASVAGEGGGEPQKPAR